MSQKKNYYDVLGIPPTATDKEIKQAYRRLAMGLHPDRNPNNSEAEERFKQVTEAHSVLTDAGRKEQYDRELRMDMAFGGAPQRGGVVINIVDIFGGRGGFAVRVEVPQGFEVDSNGFPGADFAGTIFEQIFGGRSNRRGPRAEYYSPPPGPTMDEVARANIFELAQMAARGNMDFRVKLELDRRLVHMIEVYGKEDPDDKVYKADLDEDWLDSLLCSDVGDLVREAAGLRWVKQTNSGQILLAILDTGNLPSKVQDTAEAKLAWMLEDILAELDSLEPIRVWEKECYAWADTDKLEEILYHDRYGMELRIAAGFALVKIYGYNTGPYADELVEVASTFILPRQVKDAAEEVLIRCIEDPSEDNINPEWLKKLTEDDLSRTDRLKRAAALRYVDEVGEGELAALCMGWDKVLLRTRNLEGVLEAAESKLTRIITGSKNCFNPEWLDALAGNITLSEPFRVTVGMRLVDETEDEFELDGISRSQRLPDEVKRYSKEKMERVRSQGGILGKVTESARLKRHLRQKLHAPVNAKPSPRRSSVPPKIRR
jgi:curved DNA-binding protein CbpA